MNLVLENYVAVANMIADTLSLIHISQEPDWGLQELVCRLLQETLWPVLLQQVFPVQQRLERHL